MEMRCLENIEGIGVDLTPQIPPLAFSLSDTFLHSHCSSCFHPLLPSSPVLHHLLPTPIRYCSLPCSQIDSPLHFTSAEHHLFLALQSHPSTYWHHDPSDLRTSLRLLHHFTRLGFLPSVHPSRIGGLLTNHKKLTQQDEGLLARITEGGRLMSLARRMRDNGVADFEDNTELEEMVLCIVLTNAVEVQVNDQQGVGVAVYGPCFSWINHSCTPTACYSFTLPGSKSSNSDVESSLRITSFGEELVERINGNGLGGFGPRIVVRSIKPIKKGEEVCVAYTDLLQPKATRNLELFSRYSFICCCWRCSASPPTYVDCILHGKSAANIEQTNSSWDDNFSKYDAYEELSDCIDDIISEYLSIGNPESCCKKLENILFRSPRKEQSQPEEQFQSTFNLHPLHHLSVNAYITLASAYKIRASELLASPSALDVHRFEAFNLSRTSTAYSLLLAGAAHYLFLFERSLIVSAVHFWVSAGESLLFLLRSMRWNSIQSQRYPNSSIFHITHHICEQQGRCSLLERLEAIMDCPRSQSITSEIEFQKISKDFFNCVSRLSSKVWPFLCQSMHYFGGIKDPIDFSWLETTADSTLGVSLDLASSSDANGGCCETQNNNDDASENVLLLGVHCLLYGEYLGSICYSYPNHLTNHVRNLLKVSNTYQKNCNVTDHLQ